MNVCMISHSYRYKRICVSCSNHVAASTISFTYKFIKGGHIHASMHACIHIYIHPYTHASDERIFINTAHTHARTCLAAIRAGPGLLNRVFFTSIYIGSGHLHACMHTYIHIHTHMHQGWARAAESRFLHVYLHRRWSLCGRHGHRTRVHVGKGALRAVGAR